MAETDKDKAGEARRERLAAAMRENLKRRKAQARGRAEPAAEKPEPGFEAGAERSEGG